MSSLRRLKRFLGEIGELALGIAALLGILVWVRDASMLPAIAALLGVSAMGWYRLLRPRHELDGLEDGGHEREISLGWSAIFQTIPPWIFFVSAHAHARVHFGVEEIFFIVAGVVTSVPAAGLLFRAVREARLRAGREPPKLQEPEADSESLPEEAILHRAIRPGG